MRLTSLPPIAFRTLLSIFCANFATMLTMNVFKLAATMQPWIYIPLFVLFWWATVLITPKATRLTELLPQREAAWLVCGVLAMGMLYASVRFQYPLEPVMHRLSLTIEDDASHTQELNSLIHSEHYPAQSSFTLSDYFSMYYAAWMLPVALYRVLPFAFVTFKTVLFLGNAIYAILFPLALLYIVSESAKDRRQIYWAIYLGGFWGGLDLLMLVHPFVPYAFWLIRLGLHLDFASYAQSTVITNHHLSSGVAMLLCGYIWHRFRGKKCILFTSLLLCYAFYSSVFVFLGSFPFAVYLWLRSLRDRGREAVTVCVLSSALLFPLLWLFLRKPGATRFEFPGQHPRIIQLPRIFGGLPLHYGFLSGFLLFMLIISLQFAYFTYVLIYKRQTLSRNEAILACLALAYIVSTYFIGFSHANNYCMRGIIVPEFVLCWIASSRMPVSVSRGLTVLLLIVALPTFQWIANPVLRGIKDIFHPHSFLQGTSEIVALNMDRSIRRVDYSKYADLLSQKEGARYMIEKMPTESIQPLDVVDIELESFGPCGLWAWEKNPEIPAEPCPPSKQ